MERLGIHVDIWPVDGDDLTYRLMISKEYWEDNRPVRSEYLIRTEMIVDEPVDREPENNLWIVEFLDSAYTAAHAAFNPPQGTAITESGSQRL